MHSKSQDMAFTVLQSLAATVCQSFDLRDIYHQALQKVLDVMEVDIATILLLDQHKEQLTIQESLGLNGELAPSESKPLRSDEGLAGQAVQTGQPVYVSDLLAGDEYKDTPYLSDLVTREEIRSAASFPLWAHGSVIGVIVVAQRQKRDFSSQEVHPMLAICQLTGSAIHHAQLHQERQESERLHIEQDRAEMEVRRHKEFNERIVHGMEEGVLIEDTEGRVTFANPKMAAMSQNSLDELLESHWMSLVPEEEWVNVQRHLDKRVEGIIDQYETVLLTRGGDTVPVIISATPLFEGGRYAGVLSVFTDITRRKRAEETLHALNSASVLMQEAETPEAVYQAGARELELLGLHSVIAWFDETAQIMELGDYYGSPMLIGSSIEALGFDPRGFSFSAEKSILVATVLREQRALFVNDLKPLFREVLRSATEEERVMKLSALFKVDSGILAPLSIKGRVLGALLIVSSQITKQDLPAVTAFANQMAVALENARLYQVERVRTEALERAYDELKELDRLKDEFVQNVSHELRTPVTFIRGYVELMQEGILGPITNEQRDALQVMETRTESLVNLVNDIISLKRAEMGSLELESLSLTDLAHAAVRAAEVVAEDEGLITLLDAPDDLPLICGDRQRLSQVFDNLLSNAIKFSGQGGEITVRIRQMEKGVRTEVIDRGIGIPQDQLDRIWERFYQVDGTSQRLFGGTGLGLAIVKRIIEAHGGLVGVESTWGQGSVFFFTLPFGGSVQPA